MQSRQKDEEITSLKAILNQREDFGASEKYLKEIKELKSDLMKSRKSENALKLQISELQQHLKS